MTADMEKGRLRTLAEKDIGRKRYWQRRTLTEKDIGRKEIEMI